MAKIKISDLRKVKKGDVKLEDLLLEVKQYMPILSKKTVVENMKEMAIVTEGGMLAKDVVLLEMFLDLTEVRYYTNVDFSSVDKVEDDEKLRTEKLVALYDLLCETGFIRYFKSLVPEVYALEDLVYESLNGYVAQQNSLGGVVSRFLVSMEDKLPNLEDMQSVIQNFTNLDPSKLEYIKDVVKWNAGGEVEHK